MKKARIYLDQNIYGHMLARSDWKTHDIASVLLEANKLGTGEVWLSPTNVIETALVTEPQFRAKLAAMMLHLADGKRMLESSEMLLIREFGAFLNSIVVGAFDSKVVLDRECNTARLIWLGNMALLAAGYPTGPGALMVKRMKTESQLIHARILADADTWIANIIKATTNYSTTKSSDPLNLGTLTDQQITNEIHSLMSKFQVPSQKTKTLLQKNRAAIAGTYGAIDIGAAIMAVLGPVPFSIELTFNTPVLVAAWKQVQNRHSVPMLPSIVTSASPDDQRAQRELVVSVLDLCIRAAANADLIVANIGYLVLLREVEVCMTAGELPTPGAALDVDHAMMALSTDIMVCHDEKLANNLKSYLKKHPVTIVQTARQLKNALESFNK